MDSIDRALALDASSGISVRPEQPEDEAFLKSVYASTREAELNLTGWDETRRRTFLELQFRARCQGYRSLRPPADFSIVLYGDTPAGRFVVQRAVEEVRVVDIALLPAFRNRGIGTLLMRQVCALADAAGKPVRLSVLLDNRARGWYRHLGFTRVGEAAGYEQMERPLGGPVRPPGGA